MLTADRVEIIQYVYVVLMTCRSQCGRQGTSAT